MPGHKFYKASLLPLNYSVKNDYVIMRMQRQRTDPDWSRTGQRRCLLLNQVPAGVSGKAYCLFNLNAFFSSHLFCWSNTLPCTATQTLLLTAWNKGKGNSFRSCVRPFSLWRTYEEITKCSSIIWKTFGRNFPDIILKSFINVQCFQRSRTQKKSFLL